VRKGLTIDVRRLRILRELRERGTVGATAEAMHLTPSAISQQIATLSREADVPLLVRHGRGVRLTPQAHILLDHAAAVHAQLERARADLEAWTEGKVGQIAVGAFATAIAGLIAPVLADLRRAQTRLVVSVAQVEAPECFSRLDAGDLDVVITMDYRNGPRRDDPRYHRLDLLVDPLDVALPSGHALADGADVELVDLAQDPWILGLAGGPCNEVSLAACTAAGFSPAVHHRVNDWGAMLALVAAGDGVALVPRLAVPATGTPGVVMRPTIGQLRPARHVYAAVRAGSERSPSLVALLASLCSAATRKGQAASSRPPGGP
jgi:DNA-binding transcriptional LysR family regulator